MGLPANKTLSNASFDALVYTKHTNHHCPASQACDIAGVHLQVTGLATTALWLQTVHSVSNVALAHSRLPPTPIRPKMDYNPTPPNSPGARLFSDLPMGFPDLSCARTTRPPAALMRATSSGSPGLWSLVSGVAVQEPSAPRLPNTALESPHHKATTLHQVGQADSVGNVVSDGAARPNSLWQLAYVSPA